MRRQIRNLVTSLLIAALASYGATATAQSQRNPQNQKGNSRFSGTYTLVETRSDNVREVLENATTDLSSSERDELMRLVRLPEMLSIDQRGQSITIASSLGPPVNLIADGRTRNVTIRAGANTGVQASFLGNQLVINTAGGSDPSFIITFDPADLKGHLRVSRRITSQQLSRSIVINSVYDKSSDVAQLNLYKGDANLVPARSAESFFVPQGTQLIATLNTSMDTRRTRAGDRFSLSVVSPSNLRGATIEGTVMDSGRAGAISGRADMTLNFNRIRFPDGRIFSFAGQIIGVRTPSGDQVRLDSEGELEGRSQSNRAVRRAGIGAAAGALFGAITGGGTGAAIGSALGAGAGVSSLFIRGRDDLRLPAGTQFTIFASSPRTI
jgi:hypothetical protein